MGEREKKLISTVPRRLPGNSDIFQVYLLDGDKKVSEEERNNEQ